MCVYIYTYSSQYTDAGRTKETKKFGQHGMQRAKKKFPLAILGTRAIGYLALSYVLLACIRTTLPLTPGFQTAWCCGINYTRKGRYDRCWGKLRRVQKKAVGSFPSCCGNSDE